MNTSVYECVSDGGRSLIHVRVYQPGCEVSDICNSLCPRICGPSHFGVYGPRRGEAEFADSAQDVNSLNC